MPRVGRTGERELDQIIDALNQAGLRVAEARQEADHMAGRAARAERLAALGRVAAGVAHEIRNPIAAARLQGENALAGDDARRREAIGDMLGQIDRLDGLVGELLAMTQRIEPRPVPVELSALLSEQVERHKETAAARALAVSVRGGCGMAVLDPGVICRVLDNLMTNAIRHAPEGGAVVLAADRQPGLLTLSVADSGPGVPAGMAKHLFEPFVTGRPEGTGLGLAIARELTDAHGGRLVLRDAARLRAGPCSPWNCRRRAHGHHPDRGRRPRPAPGDRHRADRPRAQAAEAGDGEAALAWLSRHAADAVLLDLRMPGMDGMDVLRRIRARPDPPPVAVLTAVPTSDNTIEAMRLGAADHLAKPIGREGLRRCCRACCRARRGAHPGRPGGAREGELVGSSAAMREVQKSIGLLADSDATVLLLGETGTGKEVVARAIHGHGRRARAPFVPVNCAAIPAELLESLLFGHVRGAFTGAVADRAGSFRDAQGGTLFLDEIGDMDLAMQAKLLRALQERVVTPVGGRPVPIDVRVVAATHRDLQQSVRDGRFREDLYYRLGVVPVALPPLRERLADIVPLAEHFLALSAEGGPAKRLSADAAARLLAHPWPGNVRELLNAMKRASTLVRRPVISAGDLAFLATPGLRAAAATDATDWLAGTLPEAVERVEREMMRRALLASGGNRAQAAERLGIRRQLLYQKLERYGLVSPNGTDDVPEADAAAVPG